MSSRDIQTDEPRAGLTRAGLVGVMTLAVAVSLAGGLLLGRAIAAPAQRAVAIPAEGSVDVGFSRDMREHHTQAVQMSTMVREATTDPEVRALALDVLLTQQQQAGQMYGWLAAWKVPQYGGGQPMAWMNEGAGSHDSAGPGSTGHMNTGGPSKSPPDTSAAPGTNMDSSMDMSANPGRLMPGMATEADLQRLARLKGNDAERLYLQLMIPHHQAGVVMARAASSRASRPEVRRLAQSIVEAQTAELSVLRRMLAARGGPLPAS